MLQLRVAPRVRPSFLGPVVATGGCSDVKSLAEDQSQVRKAQLVSHSKLYMLVLNRWCLGVRVATNDELTRVQVRHNLILDDGIHRWGVVSGSSG